MTGNGSELTGTQLRRVCDPAALGFASTAALPLLEEVIGQERVVRAVSFGIDIQSTGYHVFALGPAGTAQSHHDPPVTGSVNHQQPFCRPKEAIMQGKAAWTFMVYMAGDNNLSAAGDADLAELRMVGSTPDVNVVVEFDNAAEHGSRRYLVQKDGKDERVENLGETDSGDPDVLLDFIHWAAQNYPAERYALVLWNHGCGWQPLEIDKIARSMRTPDYNVREAVERSASPMARLLFRTSIEKIFSIPTSSERAICTDDGTGHSLDTIELGKVLQESTRILGKRVDLLGMDACLMSNLEVAYQARATVDYIVASEENEPAAGWPYHDILARLTADPGMSTETLAKQIVELYVKSYEDYNGDITQTALNLHKVNDVLAPLEELSTLLRDEMDDVEMLMWKAQRQTAAFWHFTLWDIAHFGKELTKQAHRRLSNQQLADDITGAVDHVTKALESRVDGFVVAEGHRGDKVAQCGGVNIYMPSTPKVSKYYWDLDFAKQYSWLSMLNAYVA